jgi:hypothetical protein
MNISNQATSTQRLTSRFVFSSYSASHWRHSLMIFWVQRFFLTAANVSLYSLQSGRLWLTARSTLVPLLGLHFSNVMYCPHRLSWSLKKEGSGGWAIWLELSAHALLSTTFQNNISPLYARYEQRELVITEPVSRRYSKPAVIGEHLLCRTVA